MSSYDHITKFFAEADADGSGYLTLDELTAALRRNGYKGTDYEIRTLFNKADMAGDNRISMEEYLVAMGQLPQKDHKTAMMRAAFLLYDKNGDGKIDCAELDQAFRDMGKVLPKEDIDRIMELADKGKTGYLTYEEFIAQVFKV